MSTDKKFLVIFIDRNPNLYIELELNYVTGVKERIPGLGIEIPRYRNSTISISDDLYDLFDKPSITGKKILDSELWDVIADNDESNYFRRYRLRRKNFFFSSERLVENIANDDNSMNPKEVDKYVARKIITLQRLLTRRSINGKTKYDRIRFFASMDDWEQDRPFYRLMPEVGFYNFDSTVGTILNKLNLDRDNLVNMYKKIERISLFNYTVDDIITHNV